MQNKFNRQSKQHPAFAHPWNAKCANDAWGTIQNKGFALTSFLAQVLRPAAGTVINCDIRAARKYVGPESNLGTIKIVLR
jgi:hypothetical protein